MFKPLRSRAALVVLLVLTILIFSMAAASADAGRHTVVSVESLGLVTFSTGTMYDDGSEIGGLSGITYDAQRGVYYALSDDRGDARYYTVSIDVSDGSLDAGDVTFTGVTYLRDQNRKPFEPGSLDPEGINLVRPGQLFISSEGDADSGPIDPFVIRFNLGGKQNRALPIPDKFLPDGAETFGIRDNLAFEGLTSSPNGNFVYAATENALVQDGPRSTLSTSSPSRLLTFTPGKRAGAEYVYVVSPIPQAPVPAGAFADNGLSELMALDNKGTFLVMERSFAVGVGNTVVLFEASSHAATDVSGMDLLAGPYTPMSKEYVADFETDLGVVPDNLEGMTFGPTLPDGRRLVIAVSDNNFNPSQTTQFIALAVELEAVH